MCNCIRLNIYSTCILNYGFIKIIFCFLCLQILKKSNKKKETDIDFEEKKMNLTSNQEEVEKENDYYAQRPTSPAVSPAISPPIERLLVYKIFYLTY